MSTTFSSKGFFLIEVLVSVFVVTVVVIYVLGSVYDTVGVTKRSLERTQAAFLLEENVEVLRFARSVSWNTIGNLVDETVYGISWDGSAWSIVPGAQSEGAFSRSFTCSSAYRGGDDAIVSSGGDIDTNTKRCTSTVSWQAQSETREESLSFYLINTTL